jgi:hypothetical protein
MNRNAGVFFFFVIALAGLGGCSSKPPAEESKNAAIAPDKVQGKAQIVLNETSATDTAMNAGGSSVYLVDGLHRYRLFFRTVTPVEPAKEYIAEGVIAQKVIDEIGDPDQGKNGYPLQSSCERAVRMAWSYLPFDVLDGYTSVLRARVKRYPARPVLLVTRLQPAASDTAEPTDAESKKQGIPEVSVAAEAQRASLIEGPSVQTAPLWEPAGGTVLCPVIINPEGKVSQLETGMQLCEAVPWSQFRYQPPVQRGRAVKVKTEVEVRFEPRK